MNALVAFLRARLEEDEQVASKAAGLCGCHPPAPSWTFGDETTDGRILIADDPHPTLKRKIGRRWNRSYEGLFMAEHIVRHDPARVLTEVESKRRTIDLYEIADTSPELDRDAWLVLSETVKLLALPYVSHPDYREEWKP